MLSLEELEGEQATEESCVFAGEGYHRLMRRASLERGVFALLVFVGCAPAEVPPPARGTVISPPAAPPVPEEPATPKPEEAASDEPPPPSAPVPASSSNAPSDPTPTRADEEACAARGGKIEPICKKGRLSCVLRYRDGGKRCSDKSDCIARCLYAGPQRPPPKAFGSCERTSNPCSECKAPIVGGKVRHARCAD